LFRRLKQNVFSHSRGVFNDVVRGWRGDEMEEKKEEERGMRGIFSKIIA
jgi:hypothetical protein